MAQLMAVMAVVSVASSIASGVQRQSAANREAGALRDQASLAQQEAETEARIHATRVRKFAANQKSAFLKNGITLEGSPLLVLDDTYTAGQEEVDSIMRSGAAKAQLLRERAEITKSEGRAALIGGIGNAFSSAAGFGMNAQSLFGNNSSGAPVVPYAYGTGRGGNTVKISNPYA